MMNIFEEAYAGILEARKAYDAAVTEAGVEAAKAIYKEATKDVCGLKGAELRIWLDYKHSREHGNEYLDIADPVKDESVDELISCMRKRGIEAFTFSSSWSGAVESAWLFQQAGCTLSGIVEIYAHYTKVFSDEHEKVHAYLFKVN